MSSISKLIRNVSIGIYFLMVFVVFHDILPIILFRHQYNLLPDFAKWVETKTEKNSLIICGDEGLFINYYARRNLLKRPIHQLFINEKNLHKFEESLDDLLQKNIPTYITSDGLYAYDPDFKFSSFMKENYSFKLLGAQWVEDWHWGESSLRLGRAGLFRIFKKDD